MIKMKTTDPQDELFNVVDEDDNVIGQETRRQCHRKKLIHRNSVFFLFDNDWKVFVNKRSKTKDMFPSYWSLSLGGHVEAGDSYERTAVRELEEEAGIKAKLVFIRFFKVRLKEENENMKLFYFKTNQKPKISKQEIEYGEFMTLEEIKKKMKKEKFVPSTPIMYKILANLLRKKSKL